VIKLPLHVQAPCSLQQLMRFTLRLLAVHRHDTLQWMLMGQHPRQVRHAQNLCSRVLLGAYCVSPFILIVTMLDVCNFVIRRTHDSS
jgi:hypothetical protein